MNNVVRLHEEKRWKATVSYRYDDGPVIRIFHFEEMEELHGLIERGPHWATLISCIVSLNRPLEGLEALTVEQAAEL